MARQPDVTDNGSWSLVEDTLRRGDPLFVRELRRITDAERLGAFAPRWYGDPRPEARRLLLDYLDQPLNAFRHEPLVKRLFKLAEAAGDDEVMGRFLVLFDRSVRRVLKDRRQSRSQVVDTKLQAEELAGRWRDKGFDTFFWQNWAVDDKGKYVERGFRVTRSWQAEVMRVPDATTMWRTRGEAAKKPYPLTDPVRRAFERRRLFSLPTRRYLRRRVWRYFRALGKQHPERYVVAVAAALKVYRDDDASTGVALLDNWGLVHILFHHSPALVARTNGWALAPGWGLSGLKAAPIYEPLWKEAPHALLDLMKHARCRPVRQWAVLMIRRDHDAVLRGLSPEELFGLLTHEDPEVAGLGADVLRSLPDLGVLGIDRLLRLVENPHPDTLDIVCNLLADKLGAGRVTFEQAARLAASRPLSSAQLGFAWLKAKAPADEAECRVLLRLAEAQCDSLRGDMVRWARNLLGASPHFRPACVLDYLDSRYAEVREEGWAWLEGDARVRDDVEVWRKSLESPYDDVRLRLVAELEKRTGESRRVESGRLDDELLRFVWASVLLNVHRGRRSKPVVVGQLVSRLERRPDEAKALLPILAVALRSVRGPEWRAGLAGVVTLVERNPEMLATVSAAFPELKLV